ncbi:hypothetical protein J2S43_002241 [Catenuloplanes nepalensis]|uniref:Alginate lyase domain-containing protein n=1 Tax=Catenuloplanes nepalensis TaxID=587533 RepID=A0ABT9MQQ7_9ACTN|nr:chitosanase [Catenuloplanes nepalensis]MDP9793729.1 hypothetical protein [Catenuloplanes nepalensis]
MNTFRRRALLAGLAVALVLGPVAFVAVARDGAVAAVADLDDPALKDVAMRLVSSAENSSLEWEEQYGYIEDIGDGRGYTAGIIGFCSGTGDMLDVVERYTEAAPENGLAEYLPAMRAVNGTDSHDGLDPGFAEAWRAAAADPVFRAAQDAERDETYFGPAVAQAREDGLRALGQFAYYDAIVTHGPGAGLGDIREAALEVADPPSRGGDETAYLEAFLDARVAAMRSEAAHHDTSRVDTAQRVFLRDGNLDLEPPLRWEVYGLPFEIDSFTEADPGGFVHPGVLVDAERLELVRSRVSTAAYEDMMASRYASLSRTPKPRATVECGSYSRPNNGCTDEREDAIAAYTLALAWYVTRDDRYAAKAIEIMDAWSAVLSEHSNSNAPLQAGWAGSVWPRAAEIIRYGGVEWPEVDRFATMLRTVYLPRVIDGSCSNGNWELSMIEAAVGISVFLDDRFNYDRAMAMFAERVPAYLYLTSDGPAPVSVARCGEADWHGQRTFADGLSQETCRDFTHTGYGLSAITHVLETARIQGQDLWPRYGERVRAAMELHAAYQLGADVPESLCGGNVTLGLGPVLEVGHAALGGERTGELVAQGRPAGTNNLFVAWETLTHGG